MCCTAQVWVFSTSSLAATVGIILTLCWPYWSVGIVDKRLPLEPGSFLFDHWVITPVPLYMSFYLYNWTNAQEVANPNVKPHFTEHGPYVFRDYKEKSNLVWDDEASTVTFEDKRFWVYQAHLSNGSLNDVIVQPHFPSIGVAKLSRDKSSSIRKIANFFLNREGGSLTMTATAIEWLFDGFYDDLFDFAEKLHSPLIPIYSSDFAWFLWRNGSTGAEGNFTIHTGKKDLQEMGDIKKWNASAHTGYWDGDCGKVNGTTGEMFSPRKSWENTVSLFIPEVARYLNLFPKEKVDYKGVEGWLYRTTDQTFDSGYIAPDTKCFCVKENGCPKLGATDFSPVTYGVPIYVSHPHFLLADPSYLENTTGMSPDPEKHGAYLIVEPTLGAPLDARGMALISVYVEKDEAIDLFSNVAHNFYGPLIVVSIEAEITEDLLKFVKLALSASDIGQITGIVLLVLGLLGIAIGSWLTLTNRWSCGKQPEPLVESPKGSNAMPTTPTKEESASKAVQPQDIPAENLTTHTETEGEGEDAAVETVKEKNQ